MSSQYEHTKTEAAHLLTHHLSLTKTNKIGPQMHTLLGSCTTRSYTHQLHYVKVHMSYTHRDFSPTDCQAYMDRESQAQVFFCFLCSLQDL